MRPVKAISRADKVNMGTVVVDQALPTNTLDQLDPFLLIHHWYQNFEGGRKQKELGVGPHPHRGFSPVTVVFKGSLHHRDSLGNSSVVGEGGVQWMNAGKGITHSERPSKEIAESGGEFELIQFWVNNPSMKKMTPARYQALHQEDIPVIDLDGKGSFMNLISGSYGNSHGPAESQSALLISTIFLKAGAQVRLELESDFCSLIYQLDGRSLINEKQIGAKTSVLFEEAEGEVKLECLDDSRLLLLSGKKIGEKITSYGPFVMNTTTEIMQAIRDAQLGKMGVLIEEFDD